VLEAADGVQALALAKQHQGPIHLLLSDVMMPNMGGVELSRELRKLLPNVHVLYMSGHSEDTLLQQGLSRHEAQLLPKPFTKATLAQAVRRALRQTIAGAQAHA
jgi:CheY-like chemotaxis protein